LFDLTIFGGVEADDGEPAVMSESHGREVEQIGEVLVFAVDEDSKCHEGPGCGVDGAIVSASWREAGSDDFREPPRGGDRRDASRVCNFSCDATAESFVGELVECVGDFGFRPGVDDFFGGEGCARVEPHVERAVDAESHSVAWVEDLIGGDPEIGEDSVDGMELELVEHLIELGEIGVEEPDVDERGVGSIDEARETCAGEVEIAWVAIEADERGSACG
jgi:hypothetical protein